MRPHPHHGGRPPRRNRHLPQRRRGESAPPGADTSAVVRGHGARGMPLLPAPPPLPLDRCLIGSSPPRRSLGEVAPPLRIPGIDRPMLLAFRRTPQVLSAPCRLPPMTTSRRFDRPCLAWHP